MVWSDLEYKFELLIRKKLKKKEIGAVTFELRFCSGISIDQLVFL